MGAARQEAWAKTVSSTTTPPCLRLARTGSRLSGGSVGLPHRAVRALGPYATASHAVQMRCASWAAWRRVHERVHARIKRLLYMGPGRALVCTRRSSLKAPSLPNASSQLLPQARPDICHACHASAHTHAHAHAPGRAGTLTTPRSPGVPRWCGRRSPVRGSESDP